MAIKFKSFVKENILNVTTEGIDDNLQDVENYGMAILQIAIENKCSKVICDERNLIYNLSFLDTYQLAEIASQRGKLLRKIAVVCNQKYMEDARFYETVATNRGLRILVTPDYDAALTWLNS